MLGLLAILWGLGLPPADRCLESGADLHTCQGRNEAGEAQAGVQPTPATPPPAKGCNPPPPPHCGPPSRNHGDKDHGGRGHGGGGTSHGRS